MSTDRCAVPHSAASSADGRGWALPLALDVLCVLVFALLGRMAHAEGNLVAGTLTTAAPFMVGLLAGWLRAPCAGMPGAVRACTVRFGWWLLAWTLGGGMLLRWLLGDGLAPAFVVVAAGVLAVLLVGRRWAVSAWVGRAR